MKYRRNKVKREHGIIQGALEWLEELSRSPDVADIIPGVIEVSRSPERGMVYKYETQTGCKLLLKSNGSIQEAFVVTKNPTGVKAWIESRFPSEVPPPERGYVKESAGERQPRATAPKGASTKSRLTGTSAKARNPKHNLKNHRVKRIGGESDSDTSWSRLGELDEPNVGERLNSGTRQALRALQKSLEINRANEGKKKQR